MLLGWPYKKQEVSRTSPGDRCHLLWRQQYKSRWRPLFNPSSVCDV